MQRAVVGLLAVTAATMVAIAPASAQERPVPPDSVARLDLPAVVADAVVDFFNDPRRTRFEGDAEIVAGDTLRGDVAVLEGVLTIGGRVEGSIVVVNGTIRLRPGAQVTGDLLVVGGTVTGVDSSAVGGEVLTYPERLHYRQDGRRIRRVERTRSVAGTQSAPLRGRSDFLVTSGRSYNRVEGLPVTFGPRIETSGSNPFRIHALAIYRTESGFTLNTDRMGYYVRAEQFLGGRQHIRLGASAFSMVVPIEDWHLSDLENGLATFLFHQDFRDYYERKGFSLFSQWEPRSGPLTVEGEVRFERHRSQEPGSPWTVFDNAEPWREQPLVAEGNLGAVALQALYDSRSRATDPDDGWFLRVRAEQGFNVRLADPEVLLEPVPPPVEVALPLRAARPYRGFRTSTVDLRRYNRLDPESRLNFRLLAGGSLDGRRLPPQRQHALGGEGTLPGYQLFSLDCGARDHLVFRPTVDGTSAFYPAYGCDRFALLQTEFRGKLGFRLRLDSSPWEDGAHEQRGWGIDLDIAPDWVVFVDAGRGWSTVPGRRTEDVGVDAGVGLMINRIGLYLAHPLTGGSGLNAFIRLGPRF